MANELTHLDADGNAKMVDISEKAVTERRATAAAAVTMSRETLDLIRRFGHKKGDVLGVARVAGIQAAKKCSELIPLCHPLQLTAIQVDFELDEEAVAVNVECTVKLAGQTGVEMEALTGASIAALTIYDMCKAVDKMMTISNIRLLEKRGGKSGDWSRSAKPV